MFDRHFHVGAKAVGADAAIVGACDDIAIGELRLKMKGRGEKGADDRVPVGAVRMNAPQAPRQVVASALIFESAEHDPPVAQHNRVQRGANVQMADEFHIAAVVIHDKQLQGVIVPIIG